MQTQTICFDQESNKCVVCSDNKTSFNFPVYCNFRNISKNSELIITKRTLSKHISAN